MIKNISNEYSGVTVPMDNQEFFRCKFHNCRMVFGGTGPVSMVECEFRDVSWEMTGPAKNTLQFLRAMYHGMGAEGRKMIEATFEEIRKPPTPEKGSPPGSTLKREG